MKSPDVQFAGLLMAGIGALLISIGNSSGLAWSAAAAVPGAWWLARSAFRRKLLSAQTLAARIADIDAESLDNCLPVVDYAHELRPVAGQLNLLLDRVGTALDRERRFSASVAHELATPVAELRALAEVALQSPPGAETDLARDALDIAGQMQRLIESLIAMASCDSGRLPNRRETVEVTTLIEEFCAKLAPRAQARELHWGFSIVAGVNVETDPVLLRSIIANLLENALEYTPPSGEVFGRLERSPGGFVFTLANTGVRLAAGDLEHLFEPLWRKDRTGVARVHAGLGLALAKSLAEILGMELRAELIHPGILQMTLRLSETKTTSFDRQIVPDVSRLFSRMGSDGNTLRR